MIPKLSVFNYSVVNQGSGTIDVYVDGYIVDAETQEFLREYWGDETSVSYKSVRDQIEAANPSTVNLYVNSGGGHVGDAMAIHDYLKDLETKGVKVNRKGTGIVASAATYLVMGSGSEMTENSWFMIHNASGWAYGDVNQVENQAKTLRKFNDRIVAFYSEHTGMSKEEIGNMMNNETWLTAQEAKGKGFIQKVTGETTFTNVIKPENWQFKNTAVLNSYNSSVGKSKTEPDMKSIVDAVKKALNDCGFVKTAQNKEEGKDKNKEGGESGEDTAEGQTATVTEEALVNALEKALGGVEKDIQDTVKNAVQEELKNLPESFKNAISDGVKNGLKELGENDAFKALNKKVEDLGGELEEVKADFENNAGGAKPGGNKQTKNTAVDQYDHDGIDF